MARLSSVALGAKWRAFAASLVSVWRGEGCRLSPDGKTPLAGGKHEAHCADLASRNARHMRPCRVRAIRRANGAYIENSECMPTPKPLTDKDDNILISKEDKMALTPKDIERLQGMSHRARDHYLTVVKDLTDEQLKQRYPLACRERWGDDGHDHRLSAKYVRKYGGDEEDGVPLELLLDDDRGYDREPVRRDCGNAGDQWFSFCLNRPVNSGFVHRCEFCHKCFYFRAGCLMGCLHCGMGWYDGDDDPHELAALAEGMSVDEAKRLLETVDTMREGLAFKYKENGRGCNVPACANPMVRGLVSEGYWGH